MAKKQLFMNIEAMRGVPAPDGLNGLSPALDEQGNFLFFEDEMEFAKYFVEKNPEETKEKNDQLIMLLVKTMGTPLTVFILKDPLPQCTVPESSDEEE